MSSNFVAEYIYATFKLALRNPIAIYRLEKIMARKKFYITDEIEPQENINQWKVALYIRLSREDGDKAESDSVVNQKKLLNNYVEEHEEFVSARFFVDEDETGTNFNRPAFQKMIIDIENNNINCVIIKDLSRFGRDYIGAGNYLEHVFPRYNCRFISIIDGLDSFTNAEEINGLMVRIKSLIHDKNSQDISKKVRATKDMQRSDGKYISPLAPFGYKKDPNNRYKLIIDNEAVPIIVDIFNWYLDGLGMIRIAQKLNSLGVMSRSEYRKTGSLYESDTVVSNSKGWHPNSIRQVLTNKAYIGTVDQRRKTTRNYKDRKTIFLDDKDHFIVYDMHQAIINKSKFDEVKTIIDSRCIKTSNNNEKVYVFSGLLRCSDCNSSLIRNSTFQKGKCYTYYKCRAYNQRGIKICPHSHSIKEEKIYSIVLVTLNMQIQSLVDIKRVLKQINQNNKIAKLTMNYSRLINDKKEKCEKLQMLKLNTYSDWKSDEISKDDYIFMRDKLDDKIQKLNKEINCLENEKQTEEDIRNNEFSWLENIIQKGFLKELTREVTTALIDNIYISQDKNVRIVFKYHDEYNRLVDYIDKYSNTSNCVEGIINHVAQ